jgi:hypothetical protein
MEGLQRGKHVSAAGQIRIVVSSRTTIELVFVAQLSCSLADTVARDMAARRPGPRTFLTLPLIGQH